MAKKVKSSKSARKQPSKLIQKAPTGIAGLDDITEGGLPKGRPSLICGTAGCGKTLISTYFLAHGAKKYNEPGVFVSFEEPPNQLVQNFASLGFDLDELVKAKKFGFVHFETDTFDTGMSQEYDLGGVIARDLNVRRVSRSR
ncbi:MAG: hypothetical protein HOK97_23980 [Deltaproteobacteria bacterium]|jgi:circadian clock protein KaiC|nr:hypothetical protein [Deltaproteobacteria bacterium]